MPAIPSKKGNAMAWGTIIITRRRRVDILENCGLQAELNMTCLTLIPEVQCKNLSETVNKGDQSCF